MKINNLKKDTRNANKGTDVGREIISNSFERYGAGRSILVDKNNNIIAGNHALEGAMSAGITDAIVVETTGDKLVVVKRKDIDINSAAGRGLALADNSSAQKNIQLDMGVVAELQTEFDIDLEELGIEISAPAMGGPHFNEDDYDSDDGTEQMETDNSKGGGESMASFTENLFPVAVALNKAQKLGWDQFKKQHSFKSDQEAFDTIYKHAKETL